MIEEKRVHSKAESTKILHVDSGICPSDSISRVLTAAIVERLSGRDASVAISYRDLIANPIPYMNLRTMPGSHPRAIAEDLLTGEERLARRTTEKVLNEFLSAEVIVLGVPMYNFGVAAQLKSWLDAIVIPGSTFSYTAEGPKGLAGKKRVILAITRGGSYGATEFMATMEHAESHVRSVLAVIGIVEPEVVLAEGVALDRMAATERGRTSVRALAPLITWPL